MKSIPTMSDCAVGLDDNLLDAKDIEWYEDVDSSEPINKATTPSSITTTNSFTTIHPFFHGGPAPASVVAGAHHFGCMTCPSNTITDPDNAEASSSATMHKRKASSSIGAARCINRKVAVNDKGSTDGSKINDYEPDVAEHPATASDNEADTKPEEDTDLAYASTKAMGDADREVSLFSSL
jgi:hypothetical protein